MTCKYTGAVGLEVASLVIIHEYSAFLAYQTVFATFSPLTLYIDFQSGNLTA
jgi:hypothetical protein